jgi:hypothetical protein
VKSQIIPRVPTLSICLHPFGLVIGCSVATNHDASIIVRSDRGSIDGWV